MSFLRSVVELVGITSTASPVIKEISKLEDFQGPFRVHSSVLHTSDGAFENPKTFKDVLSTISDRQLYVFSAHDMSATGYVWCAVLRNGADGNDDLNIEIINMHGDTITEGDDSVVRSIRVRKNHESDVSAEITTSGTLIRTIRQLQWTVRFRGRKEPLTIGKEIMLSWGPPEMR